MSEWVQVATREDFQDSHSKVVTMDTTTIALFLVDGNVYAMEDGCPHMLASLSQGTLDGTTIICPWHGGRFSLHTGSCLGPRHYDSARVYRVCWEDDKVLLEWPPGQSKLLIR